MPGNFISAEIKPVANYTRRAAIAMQRLGFRILYCGEYISVEGDKSLWASIFNVSFNLQKQDLGSSLIEPEIDHHIFLPYKISIPEQLKDIIEDIVFVEPPVLFE